jgi:hypothetical protein
MHVVIISDKSPEKEYKLFASYKCAELGTCSGIYYEANTMEADGYQYQIKNDQDIVTFVEAIKPDMILVDSVARLPRSMLLAYLAWKKQIPMVGIMWQPTNRMVHNYEVNYPMLSHVVLMKGWNPTSTGVNTSRYGWDYWPPYDSTKVYDTREARDIGVLVTHRELANYLNARSVPSYYEDIENIAAYCDLLRRAKVAVDICNLSFDTGPMEITGCGALLVTSKDNTLSSFFDEERHFVVYQDLNDLTHKCRFYLNHVEDRQVMSQKTMAKCRDELSPRNWWLKLIRKAEEATGKDIL